MFHKYNYDHFWNIELETTMLGVSVVHSCLLLTSCYSDCSWYFLIQIPCVYSFFQTVPNGLIQIKHTSGTIIYRLFLKFRTLQAYRHLQSNFWNCTFMNISYRICLLHWTDNGYANTLCTCLLHIGLVQTPGFGYILVLICYRYAITIY